MYEVEILTDQQLLRDYSENRSETAFAELVRRYVDFVYSAALRLVCDGHLADDVTQGVFVALAQNARQMGNRPVLAGWLHRVAQNLAANTVRSEVRRRDRERESAHMNELLSSEEDASWDLIAPHLDAALGELNETDRNAVWLRYFQRKSAREVAQVLGTTEEAAQKRINRALERLRRFFRKQGVTISASGLVVLSANAVQAAPPALAQAVTTAALAKGAVTTASTPGLIKATFTLMASTKLKTISAVIVLILLAAVAGMRVGTQPLKVRSIRRRQKSWVAPVDKIFRCLYLSNARMLRALIPALYWTAIACGGQARICRDAGLGC